MAANEYEPSAEAVEALDKEICGIFALTATGSRWKAIATHLLRRQHARESAIIEAVRKAIPPDPFFTNRDNLRLMGFYDGVCLASAAINDALRKLDAPKVPTLLEAAKAVINNSAAPFAAFDALKAAVEREERG